MQISETSPAQNEIERERRGLLHQIEHLMEVPMILLGIIWLVLIVLELVWGAMEPLLTISTVIWIIFIGDFVLKFTIAPRKWHFVRKNWLTILSLAIPALRVFKVVRIVRALRLARATRGLRLFRLVSSMNRGMKSLRIALGRRAFGYVIALSVAVIFSGAAGMLAFEKDVEAPNGIHTYPSALWWTAMIVTSLGSDYWPQTPEGRVLCLLLSIYGLSILGYITATLATFFLDRDADASRRDPARFPEVQELHDEVRALRGLIGDLSSRLGSARENQPSNSL